MANKKIEFLSKFKLTADEFKSLDKETRAVVALSCFAVTELNIFSKIYIFGAPEIDDQTDIDIINYIQRHSILRTWGAKIFEFQEFIKEIDPTGADKDELQRIKSNALASFSELKKAGGYELARTLRHETANHFSLKAARKNVDFVSTNANLSMLLHEIDGNSSFPLGEEVMFAAKLNRYTSNLADESKRVAILDEWMNFNLAASSWLRNVHFEIIDKLILRKLGKKIAGSQIYYLSGDSVAEIGEMCLPLFVRKGK